MTDLLLMALRCKTRNDVVPLYAELIRRGDVPWDKLNAVIMERWSLDALLYIKRKAWKEVEA